MPCTTSCCFLVFVKIILVLVLVKIRIIQTFGTIQDKSWTNIAAYMKFPNTWFIRDVFLPYKTSCVFYRTEISFRCRNSSEKSSLCLHSKTLLSTVRTPYSGISIARISHSCACRLMCLFARQTSQKNNTHHTDKQTSHVFAICHLLNRMSNSKLIRKSCRNK